MDFEYIPNYFYQNSSKILVHTWYRALKYIHILSSYQLDNSTVYQHLIYGLVAGIDHIYPIHPTSGIPVEFSYKSYSDKGWLGNRYHIVGTLQNFYHNLSNYQHCFNITQYLYLFGSLLNISSILHTRISPHIGQNFDSLYLARSSLLHIYSTIWYFWGWHWNSF